MIVTRHYLDKAWVDVSSPTQEDVDSLMLSYNIDASVARDLISPTPKQESREGANFVYSVIHIPVFNHSKYETREQEIDCIIMANELITARYDSIDALHYFTKQIEVDEILSKANFPHPLFGMTKEIYKFLFDELSFMDGWLRDTEQRIFAGEEREMVLAISAASRNLLTFRRVLTPHLSVWQHLRDASTEKFGKEFAHEVDLLIREVGRLMNKVGSLTEMVNELRETNNSMLSTKQNEIMKTLTIMAFVTFPLSLIAAIFGMNTAHMPIIGMPADFWIVMVVMVLAALTMFGFFRYKRWL